MPDEPLTMTGDGAIDAEKPDPADLIATAIERLREVQIELPCRENLMTLQHLQQAAAWNEARDEARDTQGVKGSQFPHEGPHDFICSWCGQRVEIHVH